MSEIVKVNKTAVVKEILQEIGALVENPPKGWKTKVEELLRQRDIKMHQVAIYAIRRKALENSDSVNNRKAGDKVRSKPVNKNGNFNVAELLEIKQFAQKHGGLDKLQEAISAIKSFQI